MNVSHPNLLKLISVDIDTQTGQCSMVSEMMVNGNIREYIRKNSTNRHRLVCHFFDPCNQYLISSLPSWSKLPQVYLFYIVVKLFTEI